MEFPYKKNQSIFELVMTDAQIKKLMILREVTGIEAITISQLINNLITYYFAKEDQSGNLPEGAATKKDHMRVFAYALSPKCYNVLYDVADAKNISAAELIEYMTESMYGKRGEEESELFNSR